jgi:hypothetical protein
MYTKLFLVSILTTLLFGCSDIFSDNSTKGSNVDSSSLEQKSNQQRNWFEQLLWEDPDTRQPSHGHTH